MQAQPKANHNLIRVNAFQFAALLERNFTEVLVAGVDHPAVPIAARLLATLMRNLNPDWAFMCEEGTKAPPTPLPPAGFHFGAKDSMPLCSEYMNSASDYYTVHAIPLSELDVPRRYCAASVMLVSVPNSHNANVKYMFELFVQLDGFIYSTGIYQDREEEHGIRLFGTMVDSHHVGKRLAQPLPARTPRPSLDIWLDVNYDLLSNYQSFFNEYLEEDDTPLEAIEDFRSGIARATLLEINRLPPKALAVLETAGITPLCVARGGADGNVALNSLKALGELNFYSIPEQYHDKPLHLVRVTEDHEVEGEFVVYLAFAMPNGCFEEQAVITGRDFKAIYSAANQLADATMISIHFSVDVDKHFDQ